jgi:hypothetical protein
MRPASLLYKDEAKIQLKNYRPISLKNINAKILKKYEQTKSNKSNRSYIMTKCDSYQGCMDVSIHTNQ